ncbi:MAG: energy-coupling factor transporter transmembrane protein EcfT [Clostridia bacterium]|nr:energy-coupling factor transporter transmembrane protein EcfT [Clostridia bacterium]
MQKDSFYTVNPAVNICFFAAVMLITTFVLHPVIVGVSLAAACAYTLMLKGRKAFVYMLAFVVPVVLAVSVINPLFNHEGVTVLFYLWNGNAMTYEAVIYGCVSACMFAALIMWFFCLNCVMTSDKYVYLFGRIIPTLSLVFSMVLRFVPGIISRIREVSQARRSISPDFGKNPIKGIRHGLSTVSVTVTWALEKAVNVSDSMKSRGYGLGRRTSFSVFSFDRRDCALSAIMLVCFAACVAALASKTISFRFYPSIKQTFAGWAAYGGCAAFAVLCALPVLLNIKENIAWRVLKSRI